MLQPREDDLFRDSTMTFGQHLEELRNCLIKSALGLAVGFLIGLLLGNYVVNFIKMPLDEALTRYYDAASIDKVQSELDRMKQSGQTLPWSDKQARDLVEKDRLLADVFYVDPAEILQQLKAAYPDQFTNIQLPAKKVATDNDGPAEAGSGQGGLMRLFLWHRSADDPRMKIKTLNAQEAFSVWLKASLLVGILLASPWVFYQVWHFVAAGLYPHERRYVHLYLPFSLGLFLIGAALAFFMVFEPILNFLFSFNRSLGIDPDPRINEWLGFVLWLPVGFGIGFQLPLVMLFLERIGIFSIKQYLGQWRIAVLVIFVASAVLTPPDPYSMILMAFPLTFLYFGGVLLCKLLPRGTSPFRGIART